MGISKNALRSAPCASLIPYNIQNFSDIIKKSAHIRVNAFIFERT